MNRTFKYQVFAASLLTLAGFLFGGCGYEVDRGTPQNSLKVRPGFGMTDCYLGMPIGELAPDWVRDPADAEADDQSYGYLQRKDAGISLVHVDHRVFTISIHFRSKGYAPFQGIVVEGIASETTIEDVILKLGQPSSISVRPASESEINSLSISETVGLLYPTQGINLTFYDGKLAFVTIHNKVPRAKVDRDLYTDEGDTTKYRSIIVPKDI